MIRRDRLKKGENWIAIAIINFREYAMSTITATDLKEVKDLITGDFSRINSN